MGGKGNRGCFGCVTVIVAIVVAVLLVVFVWLPSTRKSYSIDDVRILASVQSDGTLRVDERFTYTFHGDFTRVYRDIPYSPVAPIVVTGVTGPDGPLKRLPTGWTPASGAPSETTQALEATPSPWSSIPPEQRPAGYYRVTTDWTTLGGPSVRIEAFAHLSDTSAQFAFHWRAEAAARRWADAGELTWQLIGRGWDVPMAHVSAVVVLPDRANAGEVRAWGHGPLNGVVRRRPDGAVVLSVDDLPPATFVEAHLLFPSQALKDAPLTDMDILPSRLAAEAQLAAAANEARERARSEVQAEHRRDVIAWAVSGAATGAALVVWCVLFFSGGREYRPRARVKYLREVPEGLSPALVGALWRMGAVTNDDLSATLLDLAVRGVLHIEPGGGTPPAGVSPPTPKVGETSFVLRLDRAKVDEVDELTQPLVRLLFETVTEDDVVTMEQVEKWAKGHPARFRGGIDSWRGGVERRARELGFVEKGGGRRMFWTVLAAGLAAAVTWVMFVLSQQWWLLALVAVCVVAALTCPVMKRRSREAAELVAPYKALYRYLRDFGRLQEKPPAAAVLWEQYLVMAVVFGIATQVIEQMHVSVPEIADDDQFTSVFWFTTPAFATSRRRRRRRALVVHRRRERRRGGGQPALLRKRRQQRWELFQQRLLRRRRGRRGGRRGRRRLVGVAPLSGERDRRAPPPTD